MIHGQLPLPVPCYDLALLTEPSLGHINADFGCSQLAWLDGRWVQGPGTYSSPHSWSAITSDSGFMRSSCRPQSELRLGLVGLAPDYSLATHCPNHCIMCAAQGIKGSCWFGVILIFLRIIYGSLLWHLKHRIRVAQVSPFKGASHDTCWRQPCNTWVSVLVRRHSFRKAVTNLSSLGKVPRLLSN